MLDIVALATSLYVEHYAGELAGMHNAILKPSYVFGTRDDVTFGAVPNWHHSLDLYGIYGNTVVGDGSRTNTDILEIRGTLTSLYTLYNSSDILTFDTGPTYSLARAVHDFPATINPVTNSEYADDEAEKIDREDLGGWDFHVAMSYDKSATSLHNIVYLFGKRIGPNLLAYEPVLGLAWRQEIFLMGTQRQPKLSLFVNSNFWFARKVKGSYFNAHDGIGGTKRELYLSYGVSYFITDNTSLYVTIYGDNNLNRGSSATVPDDFRDGSIFGIQPLLIDIFPSTIQVSAQATGNAEKSWAG